jgi:hypothetical protein
LLQTQAAWILSSPSKAQRRRTKKQKPKQMNINLSLTEKQATDLQYALNSTIYRWDEQIEDLKRKGKNKNATTISIFQKDRDALKEIVDQIKL